MDYNKASSTQHDCRLAAAGAHLQRRDPVVDPLKLALLLRKPRQLLAQHSSHVDAQAAQPAVAALRILAALHQQHVRACKRRSQQIKQIEVKHQQHTFRIGEVRLFWCNDPELLKSAL